MTVATLFKNSKGNALLSYLFREIGVEEGSGGKKGKSGSQNTISSGHRVSYICFFFNNLFTYNHNWSILGTIEQADEDFGCHSSTFRSLYYSKRNKDWRFVICYQLETQFEFSHVKF